MSRISQNVVDMEAIRGAGLTLAVDPLGGAAVPYWEPINSVYKLDIAVVNPVIDPTFSFMTVDHDGKIRMDRSSPYAMARLVELKDRFRRRLCQRPRCRPAWHRDALRGVDESQSLPGGGHPVSVRPSAALAGPCRGRQDAGQQQHDRSRRAERSAAGCARYRWASSGSSPGLLRRLAAASAARRAPERASCATTAPSGPPTRTARSWICSPPRSPPARARIPGEHYRELTAEFGAPYYTRIDAPATPEQKARLAKLSPEAVQASTIAGDPIIAKLTRAPGNDAPIGGLKVVAATRLVRGPALRHREHLQDLRRELRRPGAPGRHRGRGSRHRRSCAWVRPHERSGCRPGQFPVPAGIPRVGRAPARHVAAVRRTVSAISGRPRSHGSTASTRLGSAGGRRCRWDRPAMAIHRISACHRSPATSC